MQQGRSCAQRLAIGCEMLLHSRLAQTITFLLLACANAVQAEPVDALSQPGMLMGARLVEARCIFCHGFATLQNFSRKKLDTEGFEALDRFLAAHHAPDAEERNAIARFLAQLHTGPH